MHKSYTEESIFRAENLLRESRRQKALSSENVPSLCFLDPDDDIVRHLVSVAGAKPHAGWACYHSKLFTFDLAGYGLAGLIGGVVGAPFAVLVAEQLFASGCQLLVSITSAGQIVDCGAPPYFVLIDRALRDEGTSYHYLPVSDFAPAPNPSLIRAIEAELRAPDSTLVHTGASWTTDAPYRETADAVAAARARGILAVEMEAAALYAFARARGKDVVCYAHVTNAMAQAERDFEKGDLDGVTASLGIATATARAWARWRTSEDAVRHRAPAL